nr:uncharacterized protein LOC109155647 [Ipomoea batatas]
MEFAADPEAGDQELRFHLNTRAGSERSHPVEPPSQEPVNIIHEVPVYTQGMGQVPYQYLVNPTGVPDLNYPWWQHTPQYYAHPQPYQYQPRFFPQPTYFPIISPTPNPELRRAQSERRPSREHPEAPVEAMDASGYRGDSESSSSRSGRPRSRVRNASSSILPHGILEQLGEGEQTRMIANVVAIHRDEIPPPDAEGWEEEGWAEAGTEMASKAVGRGGRLVSKVARVVGEYRGSWS